MTSHLEVLERSSGMTLSHTGLVLVRLSEKCSTIKRALLIEVEVGFKGLILRCEVEGREEKEKMVRIVVL